MHITRRMFAVALAAAAACNVGTVSAQGAFPSKPIRILVPYAPGGGTDILARLVGDKLQQRIGQTVVVDNKPGGNTAIATRLLADAPPDGHTLLLASTAFAAVPAGNPALFDPAKFTPVGRLSNILLVLVARPGLPANNVAELIAQAKANPGKFTFANSSIGGSDHLAGELFNQRAGVSIRGIPYKGAAPALNDMLGGQVDLRWDAMPSSRPLLEAGKLKALGVAEPKRSAMAPNIPTIAEQGLPGFEVPGFYGMVAPAGTPAAVVERLNKELNDIIRMPEVHAKMFELGLEPIGGTPAEFGRYIKQNFDLWTKVIKDANIKIE